MINLGEIKYAYALHYSFSHPKGKIAKLFGLCKFMMNHKIVPNIKKGKSCYVCSHAV